MNDIISAALKVMEDSATQKGEMLATSKTVKDYCRLQIGMELDEVFSVLFLDHHNRLISFEKMFRGSVAEANVHLRPIVRKVLELNASKIILTHNHPSGITKPSEADIRITKDISKFLSKIDCQVLDHIVVSRTEATSLAEMGVM